MKVIQIREYQSSDIVNTLEQLLAQARAGALTGMVLAMKQDNWRQETWAVGDWRQDPTSALHAAISLVRMLNRYATAIYPTDPTDGRCVGCKFGPGPHLI